MAADPGARDLQADDASNAAAQGRPDELSANLATVRRRLQAACLTAGRDPADVTLLPVSKGFPADDVRMMAGLGMTDFGESRDQEASAKAGDLADLPVRWHFVGRLQRNKCRSVARYASVVHSVDSERLAAALDAAAGRSERRLDVLVQVSIDGDTARGGVPVAQVPALGERVARAAWLRLAGVMAVAPMGWDPDEAFARLADTATHLRDRYPAASVISAGMSNDLEAAVRHGATCVRVGTALFGVRRTPVG